MHGLRRTSVGLLAIAVLSISACATIDKRLSENLQTDGFRITLIDEEIVHGETGGYSWPVATVKEAESIERLTRWFEERPRMSSDKLAVGFTQELFKGFPNVTVRIEATYLCVNLPAFPTLPVVLETRTDPSGKWKKSVWLQRKEDMELFQWAADRVAAEFAAEMGVPAVRSGQATPN